MAWLLDTSLLVDLLRGSQQAADWLDPGAVRASAVSVVTSAELLIGCRNRNEQHRVEEELARFVLLPIDSQISMRAVELLAAKRLSHGVGFLDCLIAATAWSHDLAVVTLNLRHFEPLPDVRTERPY
ncbi:MAG: type II toxin-antitoxin system VapC family toxin [Fimbriimonadaceae bacterium]|nr:type II toxin-antitoxin system VapC family toxin [Fimbriimonadaceae bacterium]